MAKICPLFSGSKANCTYISSKDGALLVDAGASLAATARALNEIDADIEKIRAILITHEHGDHIRGLKAISNKLKVPVVASPSTLSVLRKMQVLSDDIPVIELNTNEWENDIGKIIRFDTMHDCEGSSGYRIELGQDCVASVCTDLGIVTSSVREAVNGSNVVLLESNHDLRMLQNGPYPAELKLRIAGERGHLSNNAAAVELVSFLHSGTSKFILGHLSENNNLPTLAERTSEAALMDAGAKNGIDYMLYCALKENHRIVYF